MAFSILYDMKKVEVVGRDSNGCARRFGLDTYTSYFHKNTIVIYCSRSGMRLYDMSLGSGQVFDHEEMVNPNIVLPHNRTSLYIPYCTNGFGAYSS